MSPVAHANRGGMNGGEVVVIPPQLDPWGPVAASKSLAPNAAVAAQEEDDFSYDPEIGFGVEVRPPSFLPFPCIAKKTGLEWAGLSTWIRWFGGHVVRIGLALGRPSSHCCTLKNPF